MFKLGYFFTCDPTQADPGYGEIPDCVGKHYSCYCKVCDIHNLKNVNTVVVVVVVMLLLS